jgi:TonB family protein
MRGRLTIGFLIAIFVHGTAHGANAADRQQRSDKLDRSNVTHAVPIDYPYEARRRRITGSGVVVVEIDSVTGNVKAARMAPSIGSPILDDAALSAFRQFRFKPGTPTLAKIPINFSLGGPPVFEYRVKQMPMDEVLAPFLGKGVVLKGPMPAYPRFPPWTEKHGLGVYELHVRKDGSVAEVKILKASGDDRFDRVATGTLRKWHLRRGPLTLELPLSFKLTPGAIQSIFPKSTNQTSEVVRQQI